MKSELKIWLAVLLCVLFLGCQSESESAAENNDSTKNKRVTIPAFDSVQTDQVYVYNCADSLEFSTHVTKDSTWLFLPDTSLKVLPVKTGSGARYEGNKYIYWSKGDEAILQKPEGSFMTCQSVPQERSWAAANLRGIDFRAQGQEPGWYLELKKEGKVKYVGNYGQDSLLAETPTPTTSQDGSHTEYEVNADDHNIVISIADTLCTDSMNGMEFPQSVSITVNGDTYRGCGRYLK